MRPLKSKLKQAAATRRGKTIALSILLVTMIGIGSAIAYWNIYRKQIIRNKPENTVSDKSNGLYSVRHDKLTMDEAAGNLSGNNMNLFYDSTEYISLLENNRPLVLNDIHTCRKLVVREGTRIDVSVK